MEAEAGWRLTSLAPFNPAQFWYANVTFSIPVCGSSATSEIFAKAVGLSRLLSVGLAFVSVGGISSLTTATSLVLFCCVFLLSKLLTVTVLVWFASTLFIFARNWNKALTTFPSTEPFSHRIPVGVMATSHPGISVTFTMVRSPFTSKTVIGSLLPKLLMVIFISCSRVS